MNETLAEQDVSVESLQKAFRRAFFKAEVDEDGDLVIRDESGVNTFIKVNSERKMITFFSLWRLSSRHDEAAKHKLVNDLNNGLILVRFSVPRPNVLWCDYQFLYEGGILLSCLISTYRLFVGVCRGAALMDSTDMIGQED